MRKKKGCTEGIWRAPLVSRHCRSFFTFYVDWRLTKVGSRLPSFHNIQQQMQLAFLDFTHRRVSIEIGSAMGILPLSIRELLINFLVLRIWFRKLVMNATIFEGASCQGKLVYTIRRGKYIASGWKIDRSASFRPMGGKCSEIVALRFVKNRIKKRGILTFLLERKWQKTKEK